MRSRKPTTKHEIRAQSVPEIGALLEQEASRLGLLDVDFQDRKLKAGPLLVAFTIHCLRQSPDAREKIARENLRLYEQLLELDRPIGTPEDLNGVSVGSKSSHGKRAAVATRERGTA